MHTTGTKTPSATPAAADASTRYLPIYRVALLKESLFSAPYQQVSTPGEAMAVLRAFLGAVDREVFALLLLDTRHRVIGVNQVSVGTLNASLVHPREVFKPALLANAAAIILGHNHPSGDPTPSSEDLALTTRLVEIGKLFGIPVLDHVILGDPEGISFADRHLL